MTGYDYWAERQKDIDADAEAAAAMYDAGRADNHAAAKNALRAYDRARYTDLYDEVQSLEHGHDADSGEEYDAGYVDGFEDARKQMSAWLYRYGSDDE
jgi:hypothetical protein